MFLIGLSKIEEQLIEIQFRENFQNIHLLKFINKLVGDGATEFGILTTLINLLDDKRYRYMIDDFLSRSTKYLSSEIKLIPELVYPKAHSLSHKHSKFITDDRALIIKIP